MASLGIRFPRGIRDPVREDKDTGTVRMEGIRYTFIVCLRGAKHRGISK